ncbi:unnamed protein product, partial [Allacma fusca]
ALVFGGMSALDLLLCCTYLVIDDKESDLYATVISLSKKHL